MTFNYNLLSAYDTSVSLCQIVHAYEVRYAGNSPCIIRIKTHHYINLFVRPLHSKPEIDSYC